MKVIDFRLTFYQNEYREQNAIAQWDGTLGLKMKQMFSLSEKADRSIINSDVFDLIKVIQFKIMSSSY